MTTLQTLLKKRLRDAKRVAVVGVGSSLRGDDVAGLLVASRLKAGLRQNKRVKVFIGETAPENLTGQIKKFEPTDIIIVDSADISRKAGTVRLIDSEKSLGVSFSTHQLPLKIMADYLIQAIGCRVILLGIQPKNIDFGAAHSKEIKESTDKLSKLLGDVLKGLKKTK